VKLLLDLLDARPAPTEPGVDRPMPIGVREGRRASLVNLPRDFGLAIERSRKNSGRGRSSIPPSQLVSPVPRSLLLLMSRLYSPSRSPVTSQGPKQRDRKGLRSCRCAEKQPPHFPPFLVLYAGTCFAARQPATVPSFHRSCIRRAPLF
jgi:hypothetical protein